jgi:hypothetical protein
MTPEVSGMSKDEEVWVIERDHKPLLWNGRPVCFTGGSIKTA